MDWLLILGMVADGGALAATAFAMLFAYRSASFRIKKETAESELRREFDCAAYTGIAGAMAAVAFCVALMRL